MNRRDFFLQGLSKVGSAALQPTQWLKQWMDSSENSSHDLPTIETLGLKPGDPVNSRGDPFGDGALSTIVVPLYEREQCLVVCHGQLQPLPFASLKRKRSQTGVSILGLRTRDSGAWFHDVSSSLNRRFDGNTETVIYGHDPSSAKICSRPVTGIIGCHHAILLPWGNVLTTESEDSLKFASELGLQTCDVGWCVEINLRTGVAMKSFAIGRHFANTISCQAISGKPLELTLITQDKTIRYVSDQPFDPRAPIATQSQLLYLGKNQSIR